MTIQEHQTLEMHNVLSYRGKMTQQELQIRTQKIDQLLKDNQVKKSAPAVSTTFSVEQSPNGLVMDVEILIPLESKISVPSEYTWKEHFLLTNAVMIRHIGNPAGLQNTANELNQYIMQKKLIPISTGYNVTVKETKSPMELDQMEVDIYVSINPNEL